MRASSTTPIEHQMLIELEDLRRAAIAEIKRAQYAYQSVLNILEMGNDPKGRHWEKVARHIRRVAGVLECMRTENIAKSVKSTMPS